MTEKDKEFMLKNLGLVRQIASQYVSRTHSMDIDDLTQAGYKGLIKAVEGYDESLGYAFSTYATPTIHGCIQREIKSTDKMIRIPEYYYTKYNEYKRSGLSLKQYCEETGQDYDLLERVTIFMKPCLSLDTKLIDFDTGAHNETHLVDMIEGDSPTPEHIILYQELKKEMEQIFQSLIEDGISERNVIMTKRYYSGEDTLDSIGKDYGLTRERVRQIISKVMERVKIRIHHKELEDYLHDSYEQDFINMES